MRLPGNGKVHGCALESEGEPWASGGWGACLTECSTQGALFNGDMRARVDRRPQLPLCTVEALLDLAQPTPLAHGHGARRALERLEPLPQPHRLRLRCRRLRLRRTRSTCSLRGLSGVVSSGEGCQLLLLELV